ncbi:30S ribosomal protein S6 [Desulfobacula toluolica]|uniref:Small ribosomal subunit protein bS6 n=1 Tax=Desulfobacula toluolica (strain DSM 7467 / Tol2) TaxID=651182 RepID=K0NKH6_DESTT|nr:30S ribosomal protein S6 [Desulfobacula toluolica]CCK80443.1 RpsF: 30S ribosomal protein S6 [Desulfobacula toluolica Tol2]
MRKYETIFISDPDLQDQTRKELFDKIRNIITKENGILLNFDEWGNKKLAYEIKKKLRGHYVCITYGGTGDLVKELERNMRLSDAVLKFMTILLSDDVTREQLEKEVREAQEAEEQSKQAETAKAETAEEAVEAPVEEEASNEDEKVEETE